MSLPLPWGAQPQFPWALLSQAPSPHSWTQPVASDLVCLLGGCEPTRKPAAGPAGGTSEPPRAGWAVNLECVRLNNPVGSPLLSEG